MGRSPKFGIRKGQQEYGWLQMFHVAKCESGNLFGMLCRSTGLESHLHDTPTLLGPDHVLTWTVRYLQMTAQSPLGATVSREAGDGDAPVKVHAGEPWRLALQVSAGGESLE